MTNSKTTKRALISSVIALVLCFAMLLGTTFAWFTDSVSTGRNQIIAGNLDVELEYTTNFVTWNSVEGETELVDPNALWEPGHTEVVYLRIRNAGTLALKYKFVMNIVSETTATNVAGETFKLSDYLEYGIVDNQTAAFTDRAAARAAVTAPTSLADYSAEGHLLAASEPVYVALVVYMPESVGNEANYRGVVVPKIELGLNLVATQDTVESDSFDDQYDANAGYPVTDSAELENAITNAESGSIISLVSGSFTLPSTVVADGVSIVGNGAENTTLVTGSSGYTVTNDNVTISNVTVDGTAARGVGYGGGAVVLRGDNAKIENAVISGGGIGTWGASVAVGLQSGETAYITNTKISGGFRGIFLGSQQGSVVVDSCEIDAVYPINVDGNGDFTITVTNSKLHGWTSYGGITSATFTNTEFTKANSGYNVVAAYTDTTFENCIFGTDFKVYAQVAGFNFVFDNCYKGDTLITVDNIKDLISDSDVWNQCVCTVNGIVVPQD